MSCCRQKQAAHLATALRKKGLISQADELEAIVAEWDLPPNWTEDSAKKFWASLTGDRKHKITACIKKMTGKVDDPGAFCGGLASRVGYR